MLAALWLVDMNMFLKLMLALVVLRRALVLPAARLAGRDGRGDGRAAERRQAEKERLRSALAGDDGPTAEPDDRDRPDDRRRRPLIAQADGHAEARPGRR